MDDRRQPSGPGYSDNTGENPGNDVVKSLLTRETFVAELLKEAQKIQSKFEYLEKEDHLTILHHAVYNGLQILFPKATK